MEPVSNPPPNKSSSLAKKKRKRKVLRYFNVDRLGDLKLFDYFFWRNIWRKVQWADDADLLFHVLEDHIHWPSVNKKCVNKIPGVTLLSTKQQHAYVFRKWKQIHGEEIEELNFPETYILPREFSRYVAAHRDHPNWVYLTKQNTGSQGTGIVLVTNPSQVQLTGEDLIVQRYISNPYLVRGLKHDMRIYVLLTSIEPLRAYIHREGLVRFCTDQYEQPTNSNKIKGTVHLTNYSLNKNSKEYQFSDSLYPIPADSPDFSSKQTLTAYLASLPPDTAANFWENLVSLVSSSLVSLQPFLQYYLRCAYPKGDHGKMFHIIGYDVMMDDEEKLWLIELNANPSLNVQFEGNDEVKLKVKEKDGTKGAIEVPRPGSRDKNKAVQPNNGKAVPGGKQVRGGSVARQPQPAANLKKASSITQPSKPTRNSSKSKDPAKPPASPAKKVIIPKIEKQPSIVEVEEDFEEDDEGSSSKKPNADSSHTSEYLLPNLNSLIKRYSDFKTATIEKNDARLRPADLDPFCLVDLHVKASIYEDAISIMFPSTAGGTENRYEQIVPGGVFDQLQGQYSLMSRALRLFFSLSEPIFKPGLTLTKFMRIRDRVGGLQKADVEIAYQRRAYGGGLGFEGFLDILSALAEKKYGADNPENWNRLLNEAGAG